MNVGEIEEIELLQEVAKDCLIGLGFGNALHGGDRDRGDANGDFVCADYGEHFADDIE